jgi:hypothetical protein
MISFFQKGYFKKSNDVFKYTDISTRLFSTTNTGCLFIKPKFYADVNLSRDKEYYDFENMKLKLG